ncbi:MAG: hypothetical protein ABI200_02410 [Gaiellales bacterium]
MPDQNHLTRTHLRERASSMVEYVGLGSLSAMLVAGIAAAIDSTAGDRIAVSIVRKLVLAIAGTD